MSQYPVYSEKNSNGSTERAKDILILRHEIASLKFDLLGEMSRSEQSRIIHNQILERYERIAHIQKWGW